MDKKELDYIEKIVKYVTDFEQLELVSYEIEESSDPIVPIKLLKIKFVVPTPEELDKMDVYSFKYVRHAYSKENYEGESE